MPRELPFEFPVSGATVRGLWHVPDDSSSRVGVLLLPGASGFSIGPHRLLLSFARVAAEQGWHVMRFDFRGRGRSDGSSSAACLTTMAEDAAAACRAFRARADVQKVGVVGLCSGAKLAISLAWRERILALALWSPEPFYEGRPSARRVAVETGRRMAEYSRKLIRPEVWRRLFNHEVDTKSVLRVLSSSAAAAWKGGRHDAARLSWYRDAQEELSYGSDSGKEPPAPILLAFARGDISASEDERLYRMRLRSFSQRALVIWIEKTNHNFYSLPSRVLLFGESLQFLDRHIRGRDSGCSNGP
jgi:pimeloyl-ACP methyl ester carboxylesterase